MRLDERRGSTHHPRQAKIRTQIPMAEIVNLRQARKARARIAAGKAAAANRLRFGRTKAEKERERLEAEASARRLDGAAIKGED